MMAQGAVKVVETYFEEAWNNGNLDVVDELFHAEYVGHGFEDGSLGRDELKQFIAGYRAAFPDASFTIEDTLVDGNKVMVRWTATGTHEGEMRGIAPTGQNVTVTGMFLARLADGMIVESWSNYDLAGLLEQIGTDVHPDYARGLRTGSEDESHPDFARGQHKPAAQ